MPQTKPPTAYHGNIAEKKAALKQLRQHRALDQIVRGSAAWAQRAADELVRIVKSCKP